MDRAGAALPRVDAPAFARRAMAVARKTVHDRQEILHHFVFWRELFVHEHKLFCTVLCAKTLEPREAKPHQTILVSNNQV